MAVEVSGLQRRVFWHYAYWGTQASRQTLSVELTPLLPPLLSSVATFGALAAHPMGATFERVAGHARQRICFPLLLLVLTGYTGDTSTLSIATPT